ncbi:glycosyltransferase [Streptococcus sp. zg-86]|uniref:Glycosyltransferase n=1 Tax=Streptococcus zhangguiae TaxID=2664091 RepID=A0A6I4RJW4_9STRE|nr:MULTISPECIES: glycosyltransferase [unclassified Streptococcus]MTB64716.1 glycosyltransferase [Streptococcus sp. zg-86]MTB91536.1 glycosyltransferase [Streptococcus sp. zg-36]MWV56781.1 glycosyltransferase [Streptococcus sp. zg-70]QTH48512.1 glycosyltransferase [Streptococcus sp. zg-86]
MISIIMSIFNENLNWVQESVVSILSQTYQDFELILIVDNPNIDKGILDFLSTISKKNLNVHIFINNRNLGLAKSMNKAISMAKGHYIARMDADDIAEKNRLEEEVEFLEANDYDMVFCGKINMSENGDTFFQEYWRPVNIRQSLFLGSNVINHPTVLIKKSVLQDLNGYREFPNSEDYDLWLRMLEQDYKIGYLNQILLKYRLRDSSASIGRALEQYYVSEFILRLSLKRRENEGIDNYSIDDLKIYLDKKKITPKKQKKFLTAKNYLEKALNNIQNRSFIRAFQNILLSFVFFPELPYKAIRRAIQVKYIE